MRILWEETFIKLEGLPMLCMRCILLRKQREHDKVLKSGMNVSCRIPSYLEGEGRSPGAVLERIVLRLLRRKTYLSQIVMVPESTLKSAWTWNMNWTRISSMNHEEVRSFGIIFVLWYSLTVHLHPKPFWESPCTQTGMIKENSGRKCFEMHNISFSSNKELPYFAK